MKIYVTLPQCDCVNYLKSSMAPPLDILFSLLLCLLLLCHSTVAFQQNVDLKNKHRTSVILTVSFQQCAGLENKQNFSDSNTSNSQSVCDTGTDLCPDTGHSFCQCQNCIFYSFFNPFSFVEINSPALLHHISQKHNNNPLTMFSD